jgi:hypothetical protein
MSNAFRLLALAALLANAACSTSGGGTLDASTEGGQDAGKDAKTVPEAGQNDSGQNDAGGGDAGDSGGLTLDPECTAPADAGSGGSCVTITGDGGVECNPVTNAPCNTGAGEACDRTQIGGTHCFPPPPSNTAALCAMCDDTNGPACMPTATCVPTSAGENCARFCCVDGDCGSGHCDTVTLALPNFGVCVQ